MISLTFILKDFLFENLFIIKYTLKNEIMAIALANNYAIKYSFIYKKLAEKVCQVLKIQL